MALFACSVALIGKGNAMNEKRRATDSLEVIDTDEGITKEELANLKQVARYWGAGRLVFVFIVSLGAAAIGGVQLWDFFAKWWGR